jgi:hypothetical protein
MAAPCGTSNGDIEHILGLSLEDNREYSELHCVALADLRGSSVRGITSHHSRTAPASKTDKGCPMESELFQLLSLQNRYNWKSRISGNVDFGW